MGGSSGGGLRARSELRSGRHSPSARASVTRPALTAARASSPLRHSQTLRRSESNMLQTGHTPLVSLQRCLRSSPAAKDPAHVALRHLAYMRERAARLAARIVVRIGSAQSPARPSSRAAARAASCGAQGVFAST